MKFKEDFTGKELHNRFLFDYLTFNIKSVSVEEILHLLCDIITHEDVISSSFISFDIGALTSYNRSLRFMGERFITINWRTYTDSMTGEVIDVDTRQGISVNITGTGCRFITEENFYTLFQTLKNYDVNYTRLDIAFDDFEKVMPVEEMIQAIENWSPTNKLLATRVKFNNSRVYINRTKTGKSAKNFDLGSNGASRKLRMYDKLVEQNRTDLEYWKRLELQLRREKAKGFIEEFLLTGSIALTYISYLSGFVRFLVEHKYGGTHSVDVETSPFWVDFLKQLEVYNFLKSDILGRVENIQENNSSADQISLLTMRQVFIQTAEHLAHQFATTLAFFRKVDPELYLYIVEQGNIKINDNTCNSKYRKLYEQFKFGNLDKTSLVKVS